MLPSSVHSLCCIFVVPVVASLTFNVSVVVFIATPTVTLCPAVIANPPPVDTAPPEIAPKAFLTVNGNPLIFISPLTEPRDVETT